MTETWVRRIGAAALAVPLMAGACADGGTTQTEARAEGGSSTSLASGDGGSSADAAQTATHYMLLDYPEWKLQEAIDYRAGLGHFGELEPDLDWYAEYEGPTLDHGDGSYTIPTATVSGHTAGLEERADQLVGFGFEFQSAEVGGRRLLVAAAARSEPELIILELTADYSITLLTYDDVVVDLRDLTARLVPADEDQWLAAGGRMIDCVPLEPGCV